MSKKKRGDYSFKPFESTKSKGPYTIITLDMLQSKAWLHLSQEARNLYLCMKMEHYYSKTTDGIETHFYFPADVWSEKYHLWTRKGHKSFYQYRDELIVHGFIVCVADNRHNRTMNVYGMSASWHNWPDIDIDPNDCTYTLKRKLFPNLCKGSEKSTTG